MSDRVQLEGVLAYAPPEGWQVLRRAPDDPVIAVRVLDDGTVPGADWASASFRMARFPLTDPRDALAGYLSTQPSEAPIEDLDLTSEELPEARAARWTDGARRRATCATARGGGFLIEASLDQTDHEDVAATLRAHLRRVSWLGGGEVIRFYSVTGPYGELSNFASYPIQLAGKRWPTSEHYFQAQKFADAREQEEVRAAKTPAEAARRGRDRRRTLRRDWESLKERVMRDALEAKFRQHPPLAALLLATGDAKLIEHTDADAYWGDGSDGRGRNRLGALLMELRARLAAEAAGPPD